MRRRCGHCIDNGKRIRNRLFTLILPYNHPLADVSKKRSNYSDKGSRLRLANTCLQKHQLHYKL